MAIKIGLKVIELWGESLEEQVLAYEAEPQEKGQIVFYGPSYFTRWGPKFGFTPMREMILGKSGNPCVINRGFGSSCAEHQLYYYPRMVRPLEPKALVYEGWGNGQYYGYTVEENWELVQRVLAYVRADFPDIHIYLSGAHPTLAMEQKYVEASQKHDELLKSYAAQTPNCTFIDIMGYEPLQSKDIFVEDGVHFNAHGYQLYAQLYQKVLEQELAAY